MVKNVTLSGKEIVLEDIVLQRNGNETLFAVVEKTKGDANGENVSRHHRG